MQRKSPSSVICTGPCHSFLNLVLMVLRLDVHRANILFDEGKIEAAEKLWRRAFAIYKSLNETHPSTLFVQLKLATLAMRRNEVDNAL
jgi:hypothetical protein